MKEKTLDSLLRLPTEGPPLSQFFVGSVMFYVLSEFVKTREFYFSPIIIFLIASERTRSDIRKNFCLGEHAPRAL